MQVYTEEMALYIPYLYLPIFILYKYCSTEMYAELVFTEFCGCSVIAKRTIGLILGQLYGRSL